MHSNVLPAQAREYLWFAKNAERSEAPERVRQRSADQAADMSGDIQSLREMVRIGRDKVQPFEKVKLTRYGFYAQNEPSHSKQAVPLKKHFSEPQFCF